MNLQSLIENVAWFSLSGSQAPWSAGTEKARRYAPGFSPILAFSEAARPDFVALEPFCAVGEHFYCAGWPGAAPGGWQVDQEAVLLKLVWDAPAPPADADFEFARLGPGHLPQMLDLVAQTKPGPFGPRAIELGEYLGCFSSERLVAMAGERMFAMPLREISGVCTAPDFQGRGLARRLMQRLIGHALARGETPFLHVMRDNTNALALYRRMGFCDRHEEVVRVVSRTR